MVDTLAPKKIKKFLFDGNNFDSPDIPEEGPPPVYSQEELEAAKRDAHARGKAEGIAEAHNSFEKQTSDILMAVRDHFSILFDEEDRRSRLFEKESAQLAYTIFSRAFPALNERFGMKEVENTIKDVLETVREQPEVIIEVAEPYVDVIQTHVDGLIRQGDGPRCTIRGNNNLAIGQCRMTWANGHATRNGALLAEQIANQIEQVLADKAILSDNGEDTPVETAS